MSKFWKVLLTLVAIASFAVALSYPIRYRLDDQHTQEAQDRLIAMRDAAIESEQNLTGETESVSDDEPLMPGAQSAGAEADKGEPGAANAADEGEPIAADANGSAPAIAPAPAMNAEAAVGQERDSEPSAESVSEAEAYPVPIVETAGQESISAQGVEAAGSGGSAAPQPSAPPVDAAEAAAVEGVQAPDAAVTPEPLVTPIPSPTVDRYARTGALAYPNLEKRTLDEDKILPRYRAIYELNHDLVGWITIPGTDIDYPVVQSDDSEYYLTHDFFGEENNNGQIILDSLCDPYTPSYNLVISGHNMRSDKMFGTLDEYRSKSYWQSHKIVLFDTLMDQKEYVVFAAFYSADYDVDETGFRYYTDIQYRLDADQWFKEVRANQLYDSGIDVEFGDEFLTLTTCNKQRRQDGRFVVLCRKIREGEEIT